MPALKKEDLLLYVMEKGQVRMHQLKEEFVDKNRISEKTLYNWRKDLINEKKLLLKINEKGVKLYYLPIYVQNELENYRLKSKFLEELRKNPEFVLGYLEDLERDFDEYREFLLKHGLIPDKNGDKLDFIFPIEDEEKGNKIIADLKKREKEYKAKEGVQ